VSAHTRATTGATVTTLAAGRGRVSECSLSWRGTFLAMACLVPLCNAFAICTISRILHEFFIHISVDGSRKSLCRNELAFLARALPQ